MDDYMKLVHDILTNPRHSTWIVPGLLVAEAVLGGLIIWKIPCTIPPSPFLLVMHQLSGPFRYRDRLENLHATSATIHCW